MGGDPVADAPMVAELLQIYYTLFEGALPQRQSQPIAATRVLDFNLEQVRDCHLTRLLSRRRSTREPTGQPLRTDEAMGLLCDAIGPGLRDEPGRCVVPLAGGIAEVRVFFFLLESPNERRRCFEFIQQDGGAKEIGTSSTFEPFLEHWERQGAMSIIFGYPRRARRTYVNNLAHAFFESGAMSQNLSLLALQRFGKQSCVGGIVSVPEFDRVLGADTIPLHSLTIC